MQKTLFALFIISCFVIPSKVRADTYSTNTSIALTSPAINFMILAGSTIDSLTVNAGNIVITVPAGSAFTMTSATRNLQYTGQTENAVINISCSAGQVATMEVASSNIANQTLTITPTDVPCTPPSSGGGGGRIAYYPLQNASVVVNGGIATTTSSTVTLSLGAVGATEILISSSPDFAGSKWQQYTTSISWKFSENEGTKTIYARFRNNRGDVSATIMDNIILEKVIEIAPVATTTFSTCPSYITSHLQQHFRNPQSEVMKLQAFLHNYEGVEKLEETGFFGKDTSDAVVSFQEKYREDILKPWGFLRGTGIVGKTTLKKINELQCLSGPKSIPQTAAKKEISCPHFTKYLSRGAKGPEVGLIQQFLKERGYLYASFAANQFFYGATYEAVLAFQRAYSKDILEPWGIKSPTGYWYKSTRNKANELVGCNDSI